MILKLRIHPSIHVGKTKKMLMDKITKGYGYIYGNSKRLKYSAYKPLFPKDRENELLVFNLQKERRKTTQKKDKKNKTVSKIVKSGHWIAYVYKFDKQLLESSGISSITQNARNFTIKFR